MRTVVIGLAECELTLYAADANGDPITAEPLYLGARTEELQQVARIEEVESTPSGAVSREYEPLGLELEIRLGQIWSIDGETEMDFVLERGKKYVLVVYGEEVKSRIYQKRIYYGVHLKEKVEGSEGQVMMAQNKVFRARSVVVQKGRVEGSAPSNPTVPGGVTPGDLEESVVFIHHGPLAAGDYFLGLQQFATAKVLKSVKVIGRTSQGVGTVVGLEVNGVMAGVELTLAAGAVDEEKSASNGAVNLLVTPNQMVRWKVVSGPAVSEEMAWLVSVVCVLAEPG